MRQQDTALSADAQKQACKEWAFTNKNSLSCTVTSTGGHENLRRLTGVIGLSTLEAAAAAAAAIVPPSAWALPLYPNMPLRLFPLSLFGVATVDPSLFFMAAQAARLKTVQAVTALEEEEVCKREF